MIHLCTNADFTAILEIINEAAQAYKGIIPPDRWHEPYMSRTDLRREIDAGITFWGYEEADQLVGVMGIQHVGEVTLIRHAYVRSSHQGKGIGRQLLARLRTMSERPTLIGTWAAATWAIRFYESNGFKLVTPAEKDRLLRAYWDIPERQVETSVVLADDRYRPEMT